MASSAFCDTLKNIKESYFPSFISPALLKFTVYDDIETIPADEWELVVPKDLQVLQLPYLKALKSTAPDNVGFRYVIFCKEQQACAVAIFQLVDYKVKGLGRKVEYGMKKLGLYSDEKPLRVLVCGNVFLSGDYGFYYNNTISPQLAFDSLNNALNTFAKKNNTPRKFSFILVKDFYNTKLKALAAIMKNYGFYKFNIDPCMVLNIKSNWHTFDDYLEDISSKYKKRYRGIAKKAEHIVVKEFTAEDMDANIDKIEQLLDAVQNKAQFKFAEVNARYLAAVKKALKENYIFNAYYLDDEMIGFDGTIMNGKSFEAHFIGVNYDLNLEYAIYQNILFNYIKVAIQHKAESISFGRTAMEIKSNLGAKANEVDIYLKHTNAFTNRIIKPLFSFNEPAKWTPRDPFKE